MTRAVTDASEGQHQPAYENHNGLSATWMGARIYLPGWANSALVRTRVLPMLRKGAVEAPARAPAYRDRDGGG